MKDEKMMDKEKEDMLSDEMIKGMGKKTMTIEEMKSKMEEMASMMSEMASMMSMMRGK